MDYNVNLTDKITISGLAVDIFMKNYYNNNIAIINKKSMYRAEILNKVIMVVLQRYINRIVKIFIIMM